MLLLSTSSLKWYWLHKIFTITKKSKYEWIDLVIDENEYDTMDEVYLKWLSDAFEIPILSITAPSKWLNKEKIDNIVKIAKTLNTQVINFFPPHLSDKNTEYFISYLNKIKKDLRIKITLQNVEQKFMLFIIPEYRWNNLIELKKVTWDTAFNISSVDKSSWIDLNKAISTLWNTLTNIYLNDKYWTKDFLLPWMAWWWVSHMPIESFLIKLKTSWYNWFFCLKVKPSEIWVWNNDKIMYNLDFVRNYYIKHFLEYK